MRWGRRRDFPPSALEAVQSGDPLRQPVNPKWTRTGEFGRDDGAQHAAVTVLIELYGIGRRHDVPKDACYVGRSGDC